MHQTTTAGQKITCRVKYLYSAGYAGLLCQNITCYAVRSFPVRFPLMIYNYEYMTVGSLHSYDLKEFNLTLGNESGIAVLSE